MHLKRLRVDNVGSMLRPDSLREAFAAHSQGQLTADQLTLEQDAAIRALVRDQEAIGFPIVVDGEFRRSIYQESFSEVEGAEDWLAPRARAVRRDDPGAVGAVRGRDPGHDAGLRMPARARLRLKRNRPLEEWAFVQGLTPTPAKITILGPDRIATLHDPAHPDDVYQDAEEFLADVVAVVHEMVEQLVAAGCKYVHVDEPGLTAYADPASLEELRARGQDPASAMSRSVEANNALISGFPDDVVFGVHLCRGNRVSQWHREGSYDAIAETVLGGLAYDRLLLEYDTDRAGGFAPLRFVRKDAVVVLGLLTTKTGNMEASDEIKRRIEEASKYVPVDRLALSTQCGFASGIVGNVISAADQWRKLEMVLAVAQDVWG